jgi:hypothetical protein
LEPQEPPKKKRRPQGRPRNPKDFSLKANECVTKAKTNKKIGRKTSLTGEIYATIVNLTRRGKTQVEISNIIGIPLWTLKTWCRINENLIHDIEIARRAQDDLVERALFMSAVGFSHPEEKVFCTAKGVIKRVETTKQYPPSVDACKFWLTNRCSDTWSNKEKVATDSNVTVNLAYNPNQRLVEDESNGNDRSKEAGPTEEI